MNYLKISNKGLICPEDLMLIGSSTKREQTDKIGMFGSGWKYSLAWLLRNGCKPLIFSGTEQIDIDFAVKMHRTNAVNVITVNGVETSLTTEMGPKWTGWMALREIVSNAIDEGEHRISTEWQPEFKGSPNQTIIYVPMNSELSDVMMRFDSYFAFQRKEIFSCEIGRVFIKPERTKINIYRKGIRCFDDDIESVLDFDFNDIDINEDRLTASYWVSLKIRKMLQAGLPDFLFKKILEEEYESWTDTNISDTILKNLSNLLDQGETFTTHALQKLGGVLFGGGLVIPPLWYKKLQDMGMIKSLFELFNGSNEAFMRTDAKDVSGIKYYLNGLNINLELRSGKCESEVFVNSETAYIKDNTRLDDRSIAAHIVKRLSIDTLMSLMK